jgi:hypothetical protein
MGNITIGVIGAEPIGRRHPRKIAEHRDYDQVGMAGVFVDYRKLLDEGRLQAMNIAFPNQIHPETGIECPRRGIDIRQAKPAHEKFLGGILSQHLWWQGGGQFAGWSKPAARIKPVRPSPG